MSVEGRVHVQYSGPFFTGNPTAVADDIVHDAVADAVGEGERDVKEQLYFGHGLRTGHYARSVHGDIVGSAHGVVHDSNVVYGPWLEGVSSRNDRSRFKGYAMFRNAFQKLEKMAGEFLDRAIRRHKARLG